MNENDDANFSQLQAAAEAKALDLIARAEQTKQGLAFKLERRGIAAGAVRAALDALEASGVIDDERFGRLWLGARLARRAGRAETPRTLEAALRARGLDKRTAAAALEKVLDEVAEAALFERFLQKTFPLAGGERTGDPSVARNRLKAEGFSPALIERF
ncbi:MAG: RecX family transcriptional regulator [Treponema sp.]|jgi:regulatory protein|nr:RecX family transcriptional regulator [Treponema sp.]